MEDDAELLAAFDAATEEFVDLVRSDSRGLWFRTDNGDWQTYQPGDFSLDGREVIDVDESFVQVVYRALAGGGTVTRATAQKHAADDGSAQ